MTTAAKSNIGPSKAERDEVLIVGAGPNGLLLALLLTAHNIPVRLVDRATGPDTRPRATHYGSPAIKELQRAGVFDKLCARGFAAKDVTWRRPDGSPLARMNMSASEKGYQWPLMCLPVGDLVGILLAKLEERGGDLVSIHWGCNVVALGEDDDGQGGWVTASVDRGNTSTTQTFKAHYIVGTDGSSSTVRRLLNLSYNGHTWPVQLVATNVIYPFDDYGWTDSNFVIDRGDWYMAACISRDRSLWRVTYGEISGLSEDEIRKRQPEKFKKMLPGNPPESAYTLMHLAPYRIHQRRAPTFRLGHFLLAGDAAHVNNPFGGLGLTSGIVDTGNLADALAGVIRGVADESILDRYAEVRARAFDEVVDKVSSDNLARISQQDADEALSSDWLIKLLPVNEKNEYVGENVKVADGLHEKLWDIQHDFTQYYRKPLPPAAY
ncbi:FAD-dependent monooxygenase [Zalerion maritima]|uniref:FAD-dependent monooxygenase n=1 Tax=Zalerion maritima TaxID=339359 RepID=A0AAD5RII3_9PEZI|nr:FAD-dependent monooxygenase [Zalerion maritima]